MKTKSLFIPLIITLVLCSMLFGGMLVTTINYYLHIKY